MKTAQYTTKGFIIGSTLITIFVISQLSLFTMIPLFFLGLHPFIITGAFIAIIFLGIRSVTGKVTYTIDKDGITKDVSPFLFKKFWAKKAFQFYSWQQIKSFKTGTDMNRSYEEFEFLTINTTKGKKLEISTKEGVSSSFNDFLNVFRYYVKEASEGKLVDGGRPVSIKLAEENPRHLNMQDIPTIKHEIREKSSFYETSLAKVMTVFFTFMAIGLFLLVAFTATLSFAILFRLLFVIVPGLIYMYWRVFFKK